MYGQFLVTTLSKLCVELVSTMPFIHSTKTGCVNTMCRALWLEHRQNVSKTGAIPAFMCLHSRVEHKRRDKTIVLC